MMSQWQQATHYTCIEFNLIKTLVVVAVVVVAFVVVDVAIVEDNVVENDVVEDNVVDLKITLNYNNQIEAMYDCSILFKIRSGPKYCYYILCIEFYLVETLVVVAVIVVDGVVVASAVVAGCLTQHFKATRWTCLKGRHDSQIPLSSSLGFSTQT
jgi:hypothetical protein